MSRRGQGRGGGRQFTGGPAECVCSKCGVHVPHIRGAPCLKTRCPKCGAYMLPSS